MGTTAVGPARVLARTCRAEWTRLWTVKVTWWLVKNGVKSRAWTSAGIPGPLSSISTRVPAGVCASHVIAPHVATVCASRTSDR